MGGKTLEQWNSAAEKYAEMQEQSEYAEVNKAVVRERFKKFSGEKLLDLGCGYGWYTDYFSSIGADARGIDGSEEMIKIARERYPGSTFFIADLTDRIPFPDAEFDMVFCNQVLMDIEAIGPVFREANRVLKYGGVFYFAIVHPAFYDGDWQKDGNGFKYLKVMKRYLSQYSDMNDFWGGTAHYHRPISYYFNLAVNSGFSLVEMNEPKSYDGVLKNDDLPLFLFAEFKKIKDNYND